MTDFQVVLDRQVLVGVAFSHNVLQHSCARTVRDVIIQREGEGEVGLSIRLNVDISSDSTTDWIVIDWISEL